MEEKVFPSKRAHVSQIFPFPENEQLVEENPPCLSWIPFDERVIYKVTITADEKVVWEGETENNYVVPECFLDAGKYEWDIETQGIKRGKQTFYMAENAVKIKRVSAKELFDKIPEVHPRQLFFKEDIKKLVSEKKDEIETLKRNIITAYEDGVIGPPEFHLSEDALPMREYYTKLRSYCDRNMIACALGYALLNDEKAGEHAKKLLLTFCSWNPFGPCSLMETTWVDEIGCSLSRCLPAAYDMLYPLLEYNEREWVERTIECYGRQCYERLRTMDFCANPGNSHAGRTPAYLGEMAMVLKGSKFADENDLIAWLDYALEIYGGIFPFYGNVDGGWAEGVFYGSSYTRWYLPFLCAVERYGGTPFLHRPFYQRLTQYFLHFANPDYEVHPFGDGYWYKTESEDWPGFYAQNPCRLYAQRFGPPEALKRAKMAAKQDIYELHLLDIFIPDGIKPETSLTGELENCRSFPSSGFVSMHMNINDIENDTALMARGSKYASISHQHADQGSFALFSGGTALISPSGYFGRMWNTKHHREWTKTTKAHNTILINGEGQPIYSHLPSGKIVSCEDNADEKKAVLDLTEAYPCLNSWLRTFVLKDNQLVVTDKIEASEAVELTYLLHMLSEPVIEDNMITEVRDGKKLTVRVAKGNLGNLTLTDKFDVDVNEGEPEEYHVDLPKQYHISYTAPKSKKHDIEVIYDIEKE